MNIIKIIYPHKSNLEKAIIGQRALAEQKESLSLHNAVDDSRFNPIVHDQAKEVGNQKTNN